MTCQNVYYAWRTYSELYPTKYLCMIHDKMDQKNTCIPRVNPIPKSLNQAMPLPISLTGMLTHGHGQNAYGHFALGFWPSDPNFTIGSLSKCFQNLERLDSHMYGDLMQGASSSNISNQALDSLMSSNALHEHMTIKNECKPDCMFKVGACHSNNGNNVCNDDSTCNGSASSGHNVCNCGNACNDDNTCGNGATSNVANDSASFKRLPQALLLQLDNCGSENKN